MKRRLWEALYLTGHTPWDTRVTPPELIELVENGTVPPGRALDIGCSTGTNAIYLARHGFQTTGVDISCLAIVQARYKAWREGERVTFRCADILEQGSNDLHPDVTPFDFILDIGCLHSVATVQLQPYAAMIGRILRIGGLYLLYAWGTRQWRGRSIGLMPGDIGAALESAFNEIWIREGEEGGAASFWYLFQKIS